MKSTRWKRTGAGLLLAWTMPLLVAGPQADVQDPAIFGAWALESGTSETGPRAPVCGRACEITIEDGNVVIVTPVDAPATRYPTVGEPVRQTSDAFGFKTEASTRAQWLERTLEVSRISRTQGADGVAEMERTVMLSVENGKLVIVSTGGGRGMDGRFIYRRK